jgi:PEP-CTERM motif
VKSNGQSSRTNKKLLKKFKNICALSLFAGSMISLVPATALGNNPLAIPAFSSPIDTYVNYEVKNILDLSQTLDTFTVDTTNNTITAANLSLSTITNNLLPSIVFSSGSINATHDILTFYSTANSLDILLITLAKNTHLGSQSGTIPLYEYVIQSAYVTEVTTNGKATHITTSKNLVETTGDESVSTKSYIQDPVTSPVKIPEPATLALFASAIIGFGASRRKKN